MLLSLEFHHGVLDLACGRGRNGLFLSSHNVPVIFADNKEAQLQSIQSELKLSATSSENSECWLVDFENQADNPLAGKTFDAIMVFNYLHRPLFAQIMESIRPGGLILYETFIVDQRRFGRPNNPDFLLKLGELRNQFKDWEIIQHFEGILPDPDRAVANLIARKPQT